MSHFMRVGIFRIGLNRTDFGCWRLTLNTTDLHPLTVERKETNRKDFSKRPISNIIPFSNSFESSCTI